MQMFTRIITSIFRRGHHARACANCRLADDSDEMNLPHGLSGNRILAAIFLSAMLGACGDNSNAPDAGSGSTNAPQISVPAHSSAATQNTSTGLPPSPWAASTPQSSSDALLQPVIHTVD